MIIQINNNKIEIAKLIHSIFQVSYKVEAELLQATNFPPLNRSIHQFIDSCNKFYAYYINKNIVGIIEIKINLTSTHIQSLVVDPNFFRNGIGQRLVEFILKTYKSKIFTVETGLLNQPAINLYTGLGFRAVKEWDTNHNVRKVSFKKY